MPKYLYKGLNSTNNKVKGEIQASSRNEAISLLRKSKFRELSLRRSLAKPPFNILSKVTLEDISHFTRQFSTMITAGIPAVQCLEIAYNQTENKTLADVTRQITGDVRGGASLAKALGKHPEIFNPFYCNMVAAGEKSGTLARAITRLAEHMEKSSSLIRKVKGAMTYPLIITGMAVLAIALLFIFIIPKFTNLFVNLGTELPLPTRVVMFISEFCQNYTLLAACALLIILFILNRYYKTEKGTFVLDSLLLKIPIIGDIKRKSSISRFSQTLSTLLSSGTDTSNALSITAKTAGNKVLERGILHTVNKLTIRHSIAEHLNETGLFPPMVVHMIAHGEKTGETPSMLTKISTFYEEEVDAAVDALTSIVEPLLIIMLAIIISGILIALYLPLSNILNLM